jgi:hypothetical protein
MDKVISRIVFSKEFRRYHIQNKVNNARFQIVKIVLFARRKRGRTRKRYFELIFPRTLHNPREKFSDEI